jgi:hypothetical protein
MSIWHPAFVGALSNVRKIPSRSSSCTSSIVCTRHLQHEHWHLTCENAAVLHMPDAAPAALARSAPSTNVGKMRRLCDAVPRPFCHNQRRLLLLLATASFALPSDLVYRSRESGLFAEP